MATRSALTVIRESPEEMRQSVLVPEYLTKFRCIGSRCEDSCCIGWSNISVDEDTYARYRQVSDRTLKPLFDRYLEAVHPEHSDTYGQIKMRKGAACPFLSAERLCKIQCTLGEELLSSTCGMYPRVMNTVDGVCERSATLSCPEAARLALCNPEGIRFVVVELPVRRWEPPPTPLRDSGCSATVRDYLGQLRNAAIELLQDRRFSLTHRLILLGVLACDVQATLEGNHTRDLPKVIDAYREVRGLPDTVATLSSFPPLIDLQLEVLGQIATFDVARACPSERYRECFAEMLVGLNIDRETAYDEVITRYRSAHDRYYLPFIRTHGHILENYVVNQIFKNVFPYSSSDDAFESYVALAINFALIKLHLIGIGAYHGQITETIAVKLIQSYTKSFDHNPVFLVSVVEALRKVRMLTMTHMAVLLQH